MYRLPVILGILALTALLVFLFEGIGLGVGLLTLLIFLYFGRGKA